MNERDKLRFRLKTNHLTHAWLINQLEKQGIEIDAPTLSGALSGVRKGPLIDRVFDESKEILDRYEHLMSDFA